MANHLVKLYNDFEINNPGQLSLNDYTQFLLAHLIVLDTTNARFLWKRIPQTFKGASSTQNQILTVVWQAGKSLSNKLYPEAFKEIENLLKQLQLDSERNGSLIQLVEVLTLTLREEHLVKQIKRAYANIEIGKFKKLLGLEQASNETFTEFLRKKGIVQSGNFIIPGSV